MTPLLAAACPTPAPANTLPWQDDGARPADGRSRLRRDQAMTLARLFSREARRLALHRAGALLCAALLLLGIQAWRGQGAGALALAATVGQADPVTGQTTLAPMPFEQPGESFPGSAYYYIAHEAEAPSSLRSAVTSLAPGLHWDSEEPKPDTSLPNSGSAARALTGLTAPLDRDRALSCLTAAIYYEAASEPDDGQRAVAQVVLNRMAHPSFPKTVCGVVFQGSERATGCQFTFTCDGALARKPSRYFWDRAQQVARAALAGYVYTPVGLATHYHTFAVHPYWADSLNFLGQIGAHRFYRFTGPAGDSGAFRFIYGGGEPLPVPHARLTTASAQPDPASDPVAIERAYAAQSHQPSAPRPMVAYTPPQYTADVQRRGGDAAYRAANLPGTDAVRPEYQNSGRWISDPQ